MVRQIAFSAALLTVAAMANAQGVARSFCDVRESALQWTLSSQIRSSGPTYEPGEWPSTIHMSGFPLALGLLRPGPFDDANLFTTASVRNALAEIYLRYGHNRRLVAPMDLATRSMGRYVTNTGSYNFWPRAESVGPGVHLPKFAIASSLVSGILAIPADADDTAAAELAHYFDHLTCRTLIDPRRCPPLRRNIDLHFTPYVDGFRLPAPSNLGRAEISTGGYLTWLQHEPFIPTIFNMLKPQSRGPRVVLDKNDVDCVVNANVLRTLALYERKDARGYASACRLLNSNARDGDYNSCGNYYPNTYWFHYSVARAFADGADCLRPAVETSLAHLLDRQGADGRWRNEVLEGDDVLATAFALGALLKVGDPRDQRQSEAARRGMAFLLSNRQTDGAQTRWSGGVFFSAGVPARRDVLWTSDSFTTATVTLAMYDYARWSPATAVCRR